MIIPQCTFCVHYNPETATATCRAFPDGIPAAIFVKGEDHTRPFPGDHGIQFEPADSEAAQLSLEPAEEAALT